MEEFHERTSFFQSVVKRPLYRYGNNIPKKKNYAMLNCVRVYVDFGRYFSLNWNLNFPLIFGKI